MEEPKILRLADWKPTPFTTDEVYLHFDIHDDHTIVTSDVTWKRTAHGRDATELVLDAENPNCDKDGKEIPVFIWSVKRNGVSLEAREGYTYDRKNHKLIFPLEPGDDNIELEIQTYLQPQNNRKLSGFYDSERCNLSQCESESFRRITAFMDRPDILARYTVCIESDKETHPVQLSNGNLTDSGDLGNGRHWTIHRDPTLKPCYIFGTVNGQLESIHDSFTTMSGKPVVLSLYTEREGQAENGRVGMNALKTAMKWDEDVFAAEYNLDNFKIAAVALFTFGAMENNGLEVSQDSLVLIDPATVTYDDMWRIYEVIGHEYFHNKSGNQVTLANFFNISLKEGLTVAREQMFTDFISSEAAGRIKTVQGLRARQFVEDDSPLAHPVMPQEAQSIENLYDGTVYEKGAEVILMMGAMMGREKFIEGVKHYFAKHHGQAVTINEFVTCMEEVSGLDLKSQFFNWYTQSGRPRVKAEGAYDAASKTYTLTLEQHTPPTKDQPVKTPQVIPVRMALVDGQGSDIPATLDEGGGKTEHVILLTQEKQNFVFRDVEQEPAFHSLFRNFSAPVTIDPGLTEDQLYKQMVLDGDGFNRWDSGQTLMLREMIRLYDVALQTGGDMTIVDPRLLDTIRTMVGDQSTDPMIVSLAMTMPGVDEFEAAVDKPVDPSAITAVRKHLRETIGRELYPDLEATFERLHAEGPRTHTDYDYALHGLYSLKQTAFSYMTANRTDADIKRARDMYFSTDSMDRMIAMTAIRNHMGPEREEVMKDFYDHYEDNSMVIQKWFRVQALSQSDGLIDKLWDVTRMPAFHWENPKHPLYLFAVFSQNYEQFHHADGKGYELVADVALKMSRERISPKTSVRIMEPLTNWRKYSENHQRMMVAQLDRLAAEPNLTDELKEVVGKALPDAEERRKLAPAPAVAASVPAPVPC